MGAYYIVFEEGYQDLDCHAQTIVATMHLASVLGCYMSMMV